MFCKTAYVVPSPVAAPTTNHASAAVATPVRPRGFAGILVMVAGLAIVVASVAIFIVFRATSPKDPSSVGSTSGSPSVSFPVSGSGGISPIPVTPAPAEPEPVPTAELLNTVEGTTSIGGRFYLTDFRNTGTVPIRQPAVYASGFDADGHRILEQPGYSRRGTLAPGETTTVLVLIAEPPAGLARVDLAPRPTSGGFAQRDVAVEVVESNERATFGSMHEITGTVRNTSTGRLQFIHVVAVGRDAEGKPVSYADAFPTTHTLEPGSTSGFTLSIGTFEVRRPASWDLIAFGR